MDQYTKYLTLSAMDADRHGRMGQDTKSPTQVTIYVDAHGRMGQDTKSPTLDVDADGRTGQDTQYPTHVVASNKARDEHLRAFIANSTSREPQQGPSHEASDPGESETLALCLHMMDAVPKSSLPLSLAHPLEEAVS